IDKSGELDLRDGAETLCGEPDRHPSDRVLGERRIEDAIRPKALQQSVGGAEYTAFSSNILAEDENIGILCHGARECQIDGLDEVDLGHCRVTPVPRRARSGAAPRDPWARS